MMNLKIKKKMTTEKNYIQLVNEELQCFKANGIPYFFEEIGNLPLQRFGEVSNTYRAFFGRDIDSAEVFEGVATKKQAAKNIAFEKIFEKYFKQ